VVLGAITVGEGAKIGSGSVVIKPVPGGATVVGIPGRVVDEHHKPLLDLEHGNLPDPVSDIIRLVLNEQSKLEERLKKVETSSGIEVPNDELKQKIREVIREFEQEG
jgi:serine O-acetyltransferase